MTSRFLLVTIDTEVDKDPDWRVSAPATFRSVVEGIPGILSPLFERYGIKPTYLLSPEVIEDRSCAEALTALGDRAELGTHLHSEFIEPERTLGPGNMAGRMAMAIQKQYTPEVEGRKLGNLTRLFQDTFGYRPTSFRAGRFGMSEHTLRLLAELGYRVDSSVTPGLRWDYREGRVDFRGWTRSPRWVDVPSGAILELPVSVWPSNRLSPVVQGLPAAFRRQGGRLLNRLASFRWLRPSWHSGGELVRFVRESGEPILVLMFHSMEITVGASPYSRTEADVRGIVESLDEFFAYCSRARIRSIGMTETVNHV